MKMDEKLVPISFPSGAMIGVARSGSLCALMLDPFGNALEWLKVWDVGP